MKFLSEVHLTKCCLFLCITKQRFKVPMNGKLQSFLLLYSNAFTSETEFRFFLRLDWMYKNSRSFFK